MPHIRIDMFEGRDIEKKQRLVSEITEVVSRILQTPPEGVSIAITESKRENWAVGGQLCSTPAKSK